jgi:hypothetical protein
VTDDPKRWLSDGAAEGSIERELLASVRDVAPPAQAKEQAWRGIATSLAAGAAAASLASSAAAATSSSSATAATAAAATAAAAKTGGAVVASSLMTKAIWTIAAGSIAVGGYYTARTVLPSTEPAEPSDRAVHVAPPSAPPAPMAVLEAPEAIEPEAAPLEAAEPEARRAASRIKRSAPLAKEGALLMQARAAVRAGDVADAERMLQRMSAEFPRGVLEQERQVLEIEVLVARGDTKAAKARARSFAGAYPSSPHTARLRSLLDTP